LVPLRGKSCKEDPNSFYCTCSKGRIANGSCDESDGQKLYQYIKKRRADFWKEKLFRQNGGYLLQEKLSSYGNGEMPKLFTAEEMQISLR
jgi:hypothetical protein